jgi:hypothetical protein
MIPVSIIFALLARTAAETATGTDIGGRDMNLVLLLLSIQG